MNEVISFFKEMFMIGTPEKMPVGLCSFEKAKEPRKKIVKPKQHKKEMRLSELMDR